MTEPFDLATGAGQDAETSIPRDGYGRYKLPHPVTGSVAGRTRVTTFAKSISDTYTLSMWSQRMAMKGLTLRPDLAALVAAYDVTADRDELNKIAEQAKDAANARAAANLGTAMHAFAERMDKAVTPGDQGRLAAEMNRWPQNLVPMLQARQRALADHRVTIWPNYIERVVYVPEFDVAGTFDRLAETCEHVDPDQCPVQHDAEVLDDKTGRDLTYGWTEIAIQLACYANASHVLNLEALLAGAGKDAWEPMPPTRTDRALVVHMPVAGADAGKVTLYEVDIAEGWRAARLCAEVRGWRKHRNLARPLAVTTRQKAVRRAEDDLYKVMATEAPDEVMDDAIRAVQDAERLPEGAKTSPQLAALAFAQNSGTNPAHLIKSDDSIQMVTREPTWEEKLRACSSQGELSKVWRQATAKGEWSDELQAVGLDQLSKIKTL